MIIPIGVDCGMAEFCKKHNLRTMSFPFDWIVSYNGVSKCIENKFEEFTEPLNNRINKYDMCFVHDFELNGNHEHDKEKYNRRCNRLMNILETNEEIIFCRKGHASHLHAEHNGKYSVIANEIEDAERLTNFLKNYPELNYKIIVILVCGKCYDNTCIYKSNSDKIEIYNIATPQAEDAIFEKCCRGIFNIKST
jgi:hypothetical protein